MYILFNTFFQEINFRQLFLFYILENLEAHNVYNNNNVTQFLKAI